MTSFICTSGQPQLPLILTSDGCVHVLPRETSTHEKWMESFNHKDTAYNCQSNASMWNLICMLQVRMHAITGAMPATVN